MYERVSGFRTREMSPLEWAEARSNVASVLAGSVLPGWVLTAPAHAELDDLVGLDYSIAPWSAWLLDLAWAAC